MRSFLPVMLIFETGLGDYRRRPVGRLRLCLTTVWHTQTTYRTCASSTAFAGTSAAASAVRPNDLPMRSYFGFVRHAYNMSSKLLSGALRFPASFSFEPTMSNADVPMQMQTRYWLEKASITSMRSLEFVSGVFRMRLREEISPSSTGCASCANIF